MIPGLGRSGEGKGYALQYSGLENSMDCIVHAVTKSWSQLNEEMQKSKMAVWGGLTNSCEKKRSEKQRRKGKIYTSECRVPKNSKKR